MSTMIPVAYDNARVSKTDDDAMNLEMQLLELAHYGICQEHVFTDVASGHSMKRPGWQDLRDRVQPADTIVVAFSDRFSMNFEDL